MKNASQSGILNEIHEGLHCIVPDKKSRSTRFMDVLRVLRDSWRIKFAMLSPFPGKYPRAASISHCQIEPNDPLRFFVVDKEFGWYFGSKVFPIRTIINPKIISTAGIKYRDKEACMSFPFEKALKIKRYEIVELEYWTFFGKRRKKFYEFRARMVQHECDHMENKLIYED